MLEHKAGNISRARELFQQGVWAQPRGKSVAYVWQARSQLHPACSNHRHRKVLLGTFSFVRLLYGPIPCWNLINLKGLENLYLHHSLLLGMVPCGGATKRNASR